MGNFRKVQWDYVVCDEGHKLKNANKLGQPVTVWRYAHYDSYSSTIEKQRVLWATLQKVEKMCNDSYELYYSGLQKLNEFINLHYPLPLLRRVCSKMAVHTRNATWVKVRESLKKTL